MALGVIPNGLMNDFAHFWGFNDSDIEQTVAWLKKRRIRKIDLGCIRYTNKKGEKCSSLFPQLYQYRTHCRHHEPATQDPSYLRFHVPCRSSVSFILMIFQRLDYKMHVKINSDVIKRRVMTMCIGNGTGYGQTPNAVPYNGLLDVSVVSHPQMTQLFEGIYLFVKGKFLNHKSVHPYRTREVEVEEASACLDRYRWQVDEYASGSL